MVIYLQYNFRHDPLSDYMKTPLDIRGLLIDASTNLNCSYFNISPRNLEIKGVQVFSISDFLYGVGRDKRKGEVIYCNIEKLEVPEGMHALDSILSDRDCVGQLDKIGMLPDGFIFFSYPTGGYFVGTGHNNPQSMLVERIARYLLVKSQKIERAAILTRGRKKRIVHEVMIENAVGLARTHTSERGSELKGNVISMEIYRGKLTPHQATGGKS